jgi:hypothetical protein
VSKLSLQTVKLLSVCFIDCKATGKINKHSCGR